MEKGGDTVLPSVAEHVAGGSPSGNGVGDEVRRYRIHVSSKYLDLTEKKLELTRLPHERPGEERDGEAAKSDEDDVGGELNEEGVVTKREIEGLVDYWLENYSWRTRESYYNTAYPQYRTGFMIPESGATTNTNTNANVNANNNAPNESGFNRSLRIHFLHIRSHRADAVPLLLVPNFPSSSLSLDLEELVRELCEPSETLGDDRGAQGRGHKQAFDIVIPSTPGTGFSDELPGSKSDVMKETARLFGRLMKRLGYENYIASMMGSGRERGGEVDYFLGKEIAEEEGCRGVHLIEPRWGVPTVKEGVWDWVRWKVALFFHAGIWGYEERDWKNLRGQSRKGEQRSLTRIPLLSGKKRKVKYGALASLGLREPDTLAYALCDSPVGLLSFVAAALRKKSPKHRLSKEKIIDLCQLSWLPGPEAALRYYANAMVESEQAETERGDTKRRRVAITVFDGEEAAVGYNPPAWGMARYEVIFVQRVVGKAGLLAWERADVVFEGVRGLARGVLRLDEGRLRLRLRRLEEVVVDDGEDGEDGDDDAHGMQLDVESPDTIVAG